MSGNVSLAAPCGLYCGDCESLDKNCTGCMQVRGKPFWAAQYGVDVCPLYGCSVITHGLEHCGECNDFPCQTFLSMRDPSMTDEQFEASISRRKSDLIRRRDIGTEAWLKERY